jgi:CubicO group peptidase (beta-lactamase class C family)
MNKPDAAQAPKPLADSTAALRGCVDRSVHKHMQSKLSAGLAVGVIAGEGSTARSFFYGSTAGAGSRPPDDDTIFEIGSITKVFTTTVLAEMHLAKEVDLDDSVNRFLPASARLPGRGGVEVTLRHLATHTSGLPRLPGNLDFKQADPKNPYAHYTVDDLYDGLAKSKLKSKPGTRSEYSNFGSGLLGHVLAKAAATDYETLVKQRICEPLRLIDTTITLSQDQQRRLAVGHSGGEAVANWDLPALAGAGALRSTLSDMLRLLRANVEPATTPLERAIRFSHEIQVQRKYRVYRDFGCMAPLIVAGLAGLFTWQSFGLPACGRRDSTRWRWAGTSTTCCSTSPCYGTTEAQGATRRTWPSCGTFPEAWFCLPIPTENRIPAAAAWCDRWNPSLTQRGERSPGARCTIDLTFGLSSLSYIVVACGRTFHGVRP